MKKEYIVIVVALALLGIGAFFSSRSRSDVDDRLSVKTEGNVVYTNSGFSPGTLIVDVGTTVTFTNESDNPMWVASDPHPVHTHHSGFDQLNDGNEYSFTFTEEGIYRYHDHLVPSHVGSIIVE